MNRKRFLPMLTAFYLLAALFCTPALAVGSVADAVEQTWGDASEQIKAVVDSVVFPAFEHGAGHCVFCEAGADVF